MNYQFSDRSDAQSRASKIRGAFVVGSTIADHADHCIALGYWSDSELRGLASIQVRAEVRDALGKLTPEGVPWAGPVGRGRSPMWRQMEFWSKHDFDFNFSEYSRRARANTKIAQAIARVCHERFGSDPIFIELEDEPEV